MSVYYPGEVYSLPPDDLHGGDPKERRHILLSVCNEECESATYAYCSTQGTEAGYGAAHILIDPYAGAYRGRGFTQPTYVYPSYLVCTDAEYVRSTQAVGRIIDELPDVRLQLGEALGIGKGGCRGSGEGAGSLRGRVVQLAADAEANVGSRYAVVVAAPSYSNERRYLNAIPILDASDFDAGAEDLLVTGADWLAEIGMESALLLIGQLQAFWWATHVSRPTAAALDDAELREIDRSLRGHLVL